MAALSDPERLKHAQDVVAHAAPGLQRMLNMALEEGGYFSPLHEDAIEKASALGDGDERLAAVRTIIAEESRLGMFVGAAVGFELARELARAHDNDEETQ